MSNGTVSADQAARKAQIDAVNRDYVLQPRLGKFSTSVARHIAYGPIFSLVLCFADYRTIGGVSGPLVIVDSVKVMVRTISKRIETALLAKCDPMRPASSRGGTFGDSRFSVWLGY